MIVALLHSKGGVGKTTLALHLAGELAAQGRRVLLIDADPQGSAIDWSKQRAEEGLPHPFSVVALARDTLHREAPAIAASVDHLVIDGGRIPKLMRSTLLAADLALLPVHPSAFDGWASAEMLTLIAEARRYRRRHLLARLVLNRCCEGAAVVRDTVHALADHDPPVLRQRIGQRVAFAEATRRGRLVGELGSAHAATRDIKNLTAEIGRFLR